MEIEDTVRRLAQMREAQVILRQVAIDKMDMLQLREAQLNIEAVDQALADERRLAQIKASEQAVHLAQQSPGRHAMDYDPFDNDLEEV